MVNKKIEDLIRRSEAREVLLEQIIKSDYPLTNFPNKENFLILAREWNSWYPSAFNVAGGCYFFNVNEEIYIIDPGFNTLDFIVEKNLDIRLIRHIFVTHFHPDHFENLTKILTRLTSKKHKITVYMNTTTFSQFKIFLKDNTEFIELKPGNHLKVEIKKKNYDFNIELDVARSYHKEIGGYMNSIGLKFHLKSVKDKNKSYKIGFMSDTDGSLEYMDYYKKIYDDCDILIPHIGAIHKSPNGYKHLYLSGIEELLIRISNKNKFIFLGEFGLELGNNQIFYNGIYRVISAKIPYMRLMKNIYELIYSQDSIISKEEKNTILILLIREFEGCTKEIENETILKEDRSEEVFLDNLHSIFQDYLKNYNEELIKDLFWSFLKIYVFEVETNIADFKNDLIDFLNKNGLENINKKFSNNLKKIIPYFSKNFRDKLLSKLIFAIVPRYAKKSLALSSLIPKSMRIVVNNPTNPDDSIVENFFGRESNYKSILNINKINEVAWKGLILLLFIYFIIVLQEDKEIYEIDDYPEGRKIICEYLKKTNHKIIPVHPSYKIIFGESFIELEGKCEDEHINQIRIDEYNSSWNINYEKTVDKDSKRREFIDIIPPDKCSVCQYYDYLDSEPSYPYDSEMERIEEEEHHKFEENERNRINAKIIMAQTFDDFFNVFFDLSLPSLIIIDSNILRERVEGLINETDIAPEQKILYLIHPYMIKHSIIFKLLINQLNQLSKDAIKQLVYRIFENPSPYSEIEEKNDIYLKLLDNETLLKEIFSRIKDDIDLEFIVRLAKYLGEKLEIEKLKIDDLQ